MIPALKYTLLGLATYIPGLHSALRRGTGGSNNAAYCYSAWMRHLSHISRVRSGVPHSVIELGPGDSLGIGICALLSGAEVYVALDLVPHALNKDNLRIFDELVDLFRSRAPIPSPEFPEMKPVIVDTSFPDSLLSEKHLEVALSDERVAKLRNDLQTGTGSIRYLAPLEEFDLDSLPAADLILSQAVLEHVDDLANAYGIMAQILRPRGLMSHQIDFRCHGTAVAWNGHLGYSNALWSLIRGRLPYLLNRTVLSDHLALLENAGLKIVALEREERADGLSASELAPRFRHLEGRDLTTSSAYLLAAKL